ncbi:substrate-binding domain-containing protein [Sinomonas halotolerans]|uniref:Substrate-binding domain-containing protein n=1 Tax=Sinomonas halotolerans TaxID=1644133 RepID=A0ABU9WXA8_9MICC
MAGRRVAERSRRPRWQSQRWRLGLPTVLVTGVALLVVGALAGWVLIPRLAAASECESTETYTVLTDATLLPAVNDAASRVDPSACIAFVVDVADQEAIAARAANGTGAPDVWIADSTRRVNAVSAPVRPEIAVPSVASSPPVVVAAKGAKAPASWAQALGMDGLALGDPLASSSAMAAVAGAVAEGESGAADAKGIAAALARLALATGQKSSASLSDSALLDAAERSGAPAVVAESSWLAYAEAHPQSRLASTVPATGSALADYPIAVTSGDAGRRAGAAAAAKALARVLEDDAGRRALAARDLRAPQGEVIRKGASPSSAAGGAGTKVLAATEDGLAKALTTWALQAMPFRSLVVMDVSGSMTADAGGKSRMQLVQEGAATGAAMFPKTASLGLWAFSRELGGAGQDYLELEALRRMDAVTGGKTQRDRLLEDIRGLSGRVGGATGLYDTTLAAYRTVKANYDPLAVNSVILFTDGANDDPGSITVDQLLEALAREKDPAKPVVVVTIGISDDADAATLQRIAAATGGSSHIARAPEDIRTVFTKALIARTR